REAQLDAARSLAARGLRRLHWDMTDGHFAAAGGFTAERARSLADQTGLASEAHLMATRTTREVDAWTDFCNLIFVHAESEDWTAAADRITKRGCEAGLAISPSTPASAVPAHMAALCMSIVPGTAGSRFDDRVLYKIRALRSAAPERHIGVDGGIILGKLDLLMAAGASRATVGTDLFLGDGPTRWADALAC
ncbi:MAG: hypothetical protein ABGW82_04575, partial [Paracoccus sp. (in: a-proteobacteria)]